MRGRKESTCDEQCDEHADSFQHVKRSRRGWTPIRTEAKDYPQDATARGLVGHFTLARRPNRASARGIMLTCSNRFRVPEAERSFERYRTSPPFWQVSMFPCRTLAQTAGAGSASSAQPSGRITLPTVTVTAQKEPADPQELPGQRDDRRLGDALERRHDHHRRAIGIYAPNTYFSDFTARKLSNARFRGIGSSPANPAHHHLYRRRAAAERQLLEHRVSRRQPGRVRPRCRRARSSDATRWAA